MMKTLEEYLETLNEDNKLDALKGFRDEQYKVNAMISIAKKLSREYSKYYNTVNTVVESIRNIFHSKEYKELMDYYAYVSNNQILQPEQFYELEDACMGLAEDPAVFLKDLASWVAHNKPPIEDYVAENSKLDSLKSFKTNNSVYASILSAAMPYMKEIKVSTLTVYRREPFMVERVGSIEEAAEWITGEEEPEQYMICGGYFDYNRDRTNLVAKELDIAFRGGKWVCTLYDMLKENCLSFCEEVKKDPRVSALKDFSTNIQQHQATLKAAESISTQYHDLYGHIVDSLDHMKQFIEDPKTQEVLNYYHELAKSEDSEDTRKTLELDDYLGPVFSHYGSFIEHLNDNIQAHLKWEARDAQRP